MCDTGGHYHAALAVPVVHGRAYYDLGFTWFVTGLQTSTVFDSGLQPRPDG
jgi:hypothetical protein